MTRSARRTHEGTACQKTVEQHLTWLDAATHYFLALAEDRRPQVAATKAWLEYASASIAWAKAKIERLRETEPDIYKERLREALEYFAPNTALPQKDEVEHHFELWNAIYYAACTYLSLVSAAVPVEDMDIDWQNMKGDL